MTLPPPAHWPSAEAFVVEPYNQAYLRGNKRAIISTWMSFPVAAFAWLVMVLGLLLIYQTLQQADTINASPRSNATISEKRVVKDGKGNINGYLLILQHNYNGKSYSDQVLVPSWAYDGYNVGQSVSVSFEPKSPDQLTLVSSTDWETMGFIILGAVLAVCGMLYLVATAIARTRRLQLAYRGQYVRGIISDSWDVTLLLRQRLNVRYQFTSPTSGKTLTGQRYAERRGGFLANSDSISKGMAVVVLYLNDQRYIVL